MVRAMFNLYEGPRVDLSGCGSPLLLQVQAPKAEAGRTPEQVRNEFRRKGITFAQWARQHNVSRHLVATILSGKRPCNYGESHRVAVLLGIKEGEIA